MTNTVLQIPMNRELKNTASLIANENGFSSLQEVARVLLTQFAKRQLTIGAHETPIVLSKKAARRYEKMDKDFEKGKNIYKAQNVKDLVSQLTK